MNEDQTTLNPVGDDAMEARIVAWVLGQASAFEAAELETWCETHPEWRVYQRRMLALHGLLGQAVQPSADTTWKLSDQRRAALDGILGTKDVVVEAKQQTQKKRWWPQLAKFAALLLVFLSVAYTAFLGIFGKVGGKASMSQEVASYSREMRAETNAPMAPSVEIGNGDDFGDGWAGKKERQTVAKRMSEPMDVPVAADASLSFQKSESADDQLPRVLRKEIPAMTMDGGVSAPKPAAASAPAAARAIVTATDNWYSQSEVEKSQVVDGTGAVYAGRVPNPTGVVAGEVIDQVTGGVNGGGGGGAGEKDSFAFLGRARDTEDLAKNQPSAPKIEAIRESQYPTEYEPPVAPSQPNANLLKNVDKSWGYDEASGDVTVETKGKAVTVDGESISNYDSIVWSDESSKANQEQPDLVALMKKEDKPASTPSPLAQRELLRRGISVSQPDQLLNHSDAKKLEAAILAQSDLVEEKRKQRDNLQRRAPMVTGDVKSAQQVLTDSDLRELQEGLAQVESQLQEKQKSFEDEVSKLEKMKEDFAKLKQPVKVTPKPLPVLDEISTTTEAYSTFSLRVSDASFKLSQAALARGERPAPESVRVEEFYNAFDYGDPVPSAKEPVSCFMEQAAHPLFATRNLVRVSMRTAAAGRSAGQPLHLTLLVDQSGSMVRADRSAVMNAAIAELTTLLGPQDQVSIIGFARTPRLIAEKIPGNEGARIRQTLAEIPSDGGTNLEQAMALAQEISQRHMQPGAQNRILLMTDGAANLGNAKPEELAERVKSMRQSGLAFDIAGIGTDGLNDELLLELARHGNGRYYVVNRLTDASDGFAKQLAGAFHPAAENVKVQVHFNPERVSRYRLIGFEKDRLKTEDFRNDAVDAAELAAAEAGQAIYQVELLPEGRGDIGEVSVRFRDTASAQIVERKWTIAHQPSAPAWDRASPSMQLAGLAMFAGEKLKGGAVGEMVTFQDWQALRANVQQYYRQNPRVAQLMEMIRQIEP